MLTGNVSTFEGSERIRAWDGDLDESSWEHATAVNRRQIREIYMSRYKLRHPGRPVGDAFERRRVAAVIHLVAALSTTACVEGSDDRPRLAGTIGAARLPPPTDAGPPATPFAVEAESGQTGADVLVVTDAEDASITYVTAGVDNAAEPADLSDPRVVTLEVPFPEAGEYQVYVRLRIGPNGADDDSFYVNVATGGAPSWTLLNTITGFTVAGEEGYDEGAIVTGGGDSTPEVWKWSLFDAVRRTVAEGALTQSLEFATREDGLQIDKFAFALTGDGYTTGFTTVQLDAGEAGMLVFP